MYLGLKEAQADKTDESTVDLRNLCLRCTVWCAQAERASINIKKQKSSFVFLSTLLLEKLFFWFLMIVRGALVM